MLIYSGAEGGFSPQCSWWGFLHHRALQRELDVFRKGLEKMQKAVNLFLFQMTVVYKNHKYQTHVVLNKKQGLGTSKCHRQTSVECPLYFRC